MYRRKNASLSLSVNAIVVLVLAITMLGLGLAFTKGMFGKLQGKLEIPPPNIPATQDEPIVLPSDEIKLVPSKEFTFSINIYNYEGMKGYLKPTIVCKDAGTNYVLTQIASSQEVPSDSYGSFKITVPPNGVATLTGKKVCTIYVCKGAAPLTDDCLPDSQSLYDQKQIVLDIQG